MRLVCFLIILFVLFTPITADSQKVSTPPPCALTIEQSPAVRGLKLNQPLADLGKVFPEDSDIYRIRMRSDRKPDEVGVFQTMISNPLINVPERLKGLRYIQVFYLDEKLAKVEFIYNSDVQWESDLHFTAAIASQLGLPTQGWKGDVFPRLTCNGFFVETRGDRKLRIERSDFIPETVKRQAAVKQKKRVEFKP